MPTLHTTFSKHEIKTREDLSEVLKQICDPLKPYYSKGYAGLSLGSSGAAYTDSTAQMEGFSRVLWGLVPLLAGESKEYELWESHLQGIKNGTDPHHEEYWGDIHDYDQKIVEMAVFGLALLLIPEKIWEPLNEQEKRNLSNWLKQINQCKVWDCNWLFFPVLVNLGLRNVGLPYDQEGIEKNLDRIDQFYLSNGWYSDGINGHSDYYVPFAIHYYGLIYAKVMEVEDPVRSQRYKMRAEAFAKDFIYWFSKDGSSLPYGRSLAYRFAQSAFWSAAVFAEIEPFSLGVMKGLLLRNLRWWFNQPIFNDAGILTIGYTYPNLVMAENYNSPGSPYWSLKTFLPLALHAEHPFWQAEEEPLPELSSTVIQKQPHMVICRDDERNHILAFNSGHLSSNEHTHTSAKYEKFVYSNFFGFSVPRAEWGLSQGAYDSMLALSEGDNIYRVKRHCEEYLIEDNYIYTYWKPWNDVEVKTWIIPGTPWHLRIHCIKTSRLLDAADGGFALGIENKNADRADFDKVQNENECLVRYSWGASGIKSLRTEGKAELIYPNANTNLLNSRTVIPTIKTRIDPGTSWLVSAVFGEPGISEDKWNNPPCVEIESDKVIVHLPNFDKFEFSIKGIKL
ncbi:DUF2264 domain-containing protein [Metabacillus elymi]|uniref:DUF2264 domain-containing protein n=1 Tax=Metabacillus elymi TaxID=2745198 RepID=A0ABX6RZ92_9BACI|nr:DUF2264 domain-containing protein [Metabacillus sp. KUDC1714]QNF26763.1 DUF2264 domain-containing protein [Metabacillus sp. KUDC1714]